MRFGRVLAALFVVAALSCHPSSSDSPDPQGSLRQAVLRPPSDAIADRVLGQVSESTSGANGIDARGLAGPSSVAVDNTSTPKRLFVADTANHRVLVWLDASQAGAGKPADKVIGQADFQHAECPARPTNATLCEPRSVAVDEQGTLYVADAKNNRVLAFDQPATTDLVADRVYGQPDFASNQCDPTSDSTLCDPRAVATLSGKLFVADAGANRVLRYDNPKTSAKAAAAFGQGNLTTSTVNSVDGRGGNKPFQLAFDRSKTPTRVWLSDSWNNRVLGWTDVANFTSGKAADKVLGQPDLFSNSCLPVGRDSLCEPAGLAVDKSGNLYVVDGKNHRVLEYDQPFTSDALADRVFGQAGSFTSATCPPQTTTSRFCGTEDALVAVSAKGEVAIALKDDFAVQLFMDPLTTDTVADATFGGDLFANLDAKKVGEPAGITFDASGNLWVSDAFDYRILEFNAPATGQPWDVTADKVVGQPDFFSDNQNYTPGANKFGDPGTIAFDDAGNLWLADNYFRRVIGFKTPLTTDFTADVVIGQTSMTANQTVFSPDKTHLGEYWCTVATDGVNAYVVDGDWNRAIRADAPFATGGDGVADAVFLQPDFTSDTANLIDERGLHTPSGVAVDTSVTPARLWVSDLSNFRALSVPNAAAFTSGAAADVVLGQTDFFHRNASAKTNLYEPIGIAADAQGNVFVADNSNSRIVEYDRAAATDTVYDHVFGQSSLTGTGCNSGGIGAATVCSPAGISVDASGNLWAADRGNHRVLRYDAPLTTDGTADLIVGQLNATSSFANFVDAAGLSGPARVAIDRSSTPNRIFVADTGNARILGWPSVQALADGQPATLVLGQPDMNSSGCATSSLCEPKGLVVDSAGRLYVADAKNNRVVWFDDPFGSDTKADGVFGQADLTGKKCNGGGASPSNQTLCNPSGVGLGPDGALYVADTDNNRVIGFLPPLTDHTADLVFGQPDFVTGDVNYSTSASTLTAPLGVAVDTRGRVFVADTGRVVAFATPVAANNKANLLLGQIDFTISYCTKSPSQYLCDPYDLAIDAADRLYVADWSNNRVVRYDDPFKTGSAIAAIYGQPARGSSDCNAGEPRPTLATLCGPQGVALDPTGTLYVADTDNHRVLAFFSNRSPTAADPFISPIPPRKGDAMKANYTFADLDGDAEAGSEIRWFMKPGATGTWTAQGTYNDLATLPVSALSRGQFWQFTVRPKDGLSFGPVSSSGPAIVANTPPTATQLKISPETPYTDADLVATYTYADADGDSEAPPAKFEWYVNGVVRPGLTQSTVPKAETKRGEFWSCRVTVSDGTDSSAQASSGFVQILNSPPLADAGPDQSLAATGVMTRITLDGSASSDADGDLLDYVWSEGVAKLGVGSQLQIDLGIGIHDVTLKVTDSEGAESEDTVRVVIGDVKPIVTVPASKTIAPGRVQLVATAVDGLGRPMTYEWKQVSGPPAVLEGTDGLTLTVFARQSGLVALEFTATAGNVTSEVSQVALTVSNLAPAASAGPRRVVRKGELAPLDGSKSADPNGDALTFSWTTTAPATLENATSAHAGLRADADGLYTATLVTNDGTNASAPALTTVQVFDPAVKHAPVALAGDDQQVELGQTVTLDGSASFDADGDRLRYRWKFDGDGGALKDTTSAKAQFKPAAEGDFRIALVVSDGEQESAEAAVTVHVTDATKNRFPVARAGTNTVAVVGTPVSLDGTHTADPDGDRLTYAWTQVDGPKVELSGADTATPTLVPTVPGLLRFALVVDDGRLKSLASEVTVAAAESGNRLPTAALSAPKTGLVGSAVTLDASMSSDADGDPLTYVFEQVAGPPVPLDDATTATPKFTAKVSGLYAFRLLASDGKSTGLPVEVSVKVSTHGSDNHVPVAVAGAPQSVAPGTTVALDGSASSDPDPLDGPALAYHWSLAGFPTGAEPHLEPDDTVATSFTPAAAGDYTFRLVVSDGELTSEPSFVRVTVTEAPKSCGCSGASGEPSTFVLGLLFLLGMRSSRDRRRPAGTRLLKATAAVVLSTLMLIPALALAAPKKGKPAPPPPPPAPAAAPTPAPLATDLPRAGTNPYLEEAKALYANFQFEGILAKLEFALAAKDVTDPQRIEIYRLMAFTHAAWDDAPKAEDALFRVLKIEPAYELKGVSPKLRAYFENAKKKYRATLAVKLEHTPPQASQRGTTTSVDVRVAQGEERVKAMTLHYRFAAEKPPPFSELPMKKGDGDSWSAPVPNLFPGTAERRRVEYFVRARGEANEPLATVGEEAHPLAVEVETIDSTRPFYRSPWFWGASAVAVGAAVAVPLLLHTPDAVVQTGSLGKEKLP